MARPVVPDVDKRRTVPLRLTKPIYRALSAILELTGDPIQEQLRQATLAFIKSKRSELKAQNIELPGEVWLAEMTDDAFNRWINSVPGNRPQQVKRGLRVASSN